MFNVLDTAVTFNPIQYGPYGAAHRWEPKVSSSLKSVKHILQ